MNMRALRREYTNITISFQILLSVPPLSTSSIFVLPCSPELCSSGKLPCPHQKFGFERCMNVYVYIDTSFSFIGSILRAFEDKIGKSWENTKRVLGENYEISNVKIHYL